MLSGASAVFERARMVRELQRTLVPHLRLGDVDALLVQVERGGALNESANNGFEPVGTLAACLFDHPAFLDAREGLILDGEEAAFERVERDEPRAESPVRYRIEQKVSVLEEALVDDTLLLLSFAVPREIPGLQRVLLTDAEPAGLRAHYFPSAGIVHAAPLVVGPETRIPPLRMVFEVERSHGRLRDPELALVPRNNAESELAADWARRVHDGRGLMSGGQLVDLLLSRMEQDFAFAPLVAPVQTPVRVLLAAEAGDVAMHAELLAGALRANGIAARIGRGQRFGPEGAGAHLTFPGATGYDHIFVEWRDTKTGETGLADVSYFGRWDAVATEENSSASLRRRLEKLGACGRAWMRRELYPFDLVVAGSAPATFVQDPSTGDLSPHPSAFDVELIAEKIL
jgi:hypothetical protein